MKDNLNMYSRYQRPLTHHAPSYKMENKATILPRSHLLRSLKSKCRHSKGKLV